LNAWQVTRSDLYRAVVEGILDYVLRDMTSPEGGFYSSEDADSEGEEGTFYVWTRPELMQVLGDREGRIFCQRYGVDDGGNFEGRTILTVATSLETVAASNNATVEDVEASL